MPSIGGPGCDRNGRLLAVAGGMPDDPSWSASFPGARPRACRGCPGDRPPRERGGKAAKRGLSREQVPVLVAADRSSATLTAVLPTVSASAIQAVLDPAVSPDILLVAGGASYFPPAAVA